MTVNGSELQEYDNIGIVPYLSFRSCFLFEFFRVDKSDIIADNFAQLYYMFHSKCYQENWVKSPKLVGQMLELVGPLSH